jgi:CDP-4-dehydro-6-deoxyglucose reductase
VTTILLSNGKTFSSTDGASVLESAKAAGLMLEHSCRIGRCSSCKAKVTSGTTIALRPEESLSRQERDDGWILTCVRAAQGDEVSLDIEDLGDVARFTARTLPCRIDSLELLSPDVVKVLLRLPPNASFGYLAGQYVDVIGHGGVRRSYSIANAPGTSERIELHIRKVPGGTLSEYWFERAKLNDLLRLSGPLGTFFFRRPTVADETVFLATGTGIAPIKAMLEALAQRPPIERPQSLTVYWGGRTAPDIYWQPKFDGLQLRFVPVLSRADSDWTGVRGHVQDALLANYPSLDTLDVYACGSNAMIASAKQILVNSGLHSKRFHSDAFVCTS